MRYDWIYEEVIYLYSPEIDSPRRGKFVCKFDIIDLQKKANNEATSTL